MVNNFNNERDFLLWKKQQIQNSLKELNKKGGYVKDQTKSKIFAHGGRPLLARVQRQADKRFLKNISLQKEGYTRQLSEIDNLLAPNTSSNVNSNSVSNPAQDSINKLNVHNFNIGDRNFFNNVNPLSPSRRVVRTVQRNNGRRYGKW